MKIFPKKIILAISSFIFFIKVCLFAQTDTIIYKNNTNLFEEYVSILNNKKAIIRMHDTCIITKNAIIFNAYSIQDKTLCIQRTKLMLNEITNLYKTSFFSNKYPAYKAATKFFLTDLSIATLYRIFKPHATIPLSISDPFFLTSALVFYAVFYHELRQSKILHMETKSGDHFQFFAGWKTRKIYRKLKARLAALK